MEIIVSPAFLNDGSNRIAARATSYELDLTAAASTSNMVLTLENTTNTAVAAHAYLDVRVGGTTSTGDPQVRLTVPSGTSYYMAADNSDGDLYQLGTGTTVGSNVLLQIDGKTSGSQDTSLIDVQSAGYTVTDGASSNYSGLRVLAHTARMAASAGTQITALWNFVQIRQQTIAQTDTAITIDKITALNIQVPTVDTSVTGTAVSGLRILDAGTVNGTMTTQTGIFIETLTAGATDIGISMANDLDLRSAGTILNIAASGFNITGSGLVDVAGVSGNIWDSTKIVHKGSGVTITERTVGATGGIGGVFQVMRTTSGNMVDGFGGGMQFIIEDAGASDQTIGQIAFVRAGADNTGDFNLQTYVTGAANMAFKVSSVGVGSFDLAGSGSDAQTDLFDTYDDPVELERFAYSMPGIERLRPGITEEVRLANRERMLGMGIITPDPGASSGFRLLIQPMVNLLAGGVYQNRARMDAQYEQIDQRLKAIGA